MNYREKIDFSSLSEYLSCPFKFLLNYILHLRPTTPNIDFVFGACWHYGLEIVYKYLMEGNKSLSPIQATALAVTAFNKLWSISGKQLNVEACYPKNPGHAADMYYEYFKKYLAMDREVEIIGVEIPFTVLLKEDFPVYIGRLDLVTLENDILNITDHKTSKYDTSIIFAGLDSSLQSDGYLTAGNIYFEKIPRITYNLAICQKSKMAFHRHIVMKRKAAIDRFIGDIQYHIENILLAIETYESECHITDRNYNPKSFKRSHGYTCTAYFRKCEYFGLCHLRNNPFSWGERAPQGYTHYEWDPTVHEQEMRSKLKEVA